MGHFPNPPLLYLNQVSTNKIIITKSKINNTTDTYCITHTYLHTYTHKHSNRNIQTEHTDTHSTQTHSTQTHTHRTHACFGLLEHIYFLNQPPFFSTKTKLFEQMIHIRLDAHLSTRWN